MSDELTFQTIQGPSERALAVLLLDVSSSMSAEEITGKTRIEGLEEGVQEFREAALSDPTASRILEVAVVCFGTKATETLPPTPVRDFHAPELNADGATALYQATITGLQLVETWKSNLKAQNVKYYRPIVLLLTDGDPTDGSQSAPSGRSLKDEATLLVQDAENSKKAIVFSVSVGQAPTADLKALCNRTKQMAEGKWKELFQWLSASSSQASQPTPGQIPSTDPWAVF
jgi:uncharacterized protein YegL